MKHLIIMLVCLLLLTSCNNKNNTVITETIKEETLTIEQMQIPSPVFTVTEEERETLAALVTLEASICSIECQKAVVSVVFNRLNAGKWGDTLEEVIYYPNAFTPSKRIPSTTPTKSAYQAVDYVLLNGCTVPQEVRYFRTDHDFRWEGYEHYIEIDNVYFGYFIDWQQGAW